MTSLPRRAYELGDKILMTLKGEKHPGKVIGYEDGHSLGRIPTYGKRVEGWAYHVELEEVDSGLGIQEHVVVSEEDLEPIGAIV